MKIDLHCHTVSNEFLDAPFNYDSSFLKTYVTSNALNLIGITNHNLFDKENFLQIKEDLKGTLCSALPGIEISLESGHILVLGDNNDNVINNLQTISNEIKNENNPNYMMTVEKFNSLFCGKGFLLIPHFDKKPSISPEIISLIDDKIICGEVESPKKFFKLLESGTIKPLYFSDIRIGLQREKSDYESRSRFTYLNCTEKNIKSICNALICSNSVALTKDNLPNVYEILNGQSLASTGINVLLGKRSSGKTYTLDHVAEDNKNALYIKQFEISKDCEDNEFKAQLNNAETKFVASYFKSFTDLLNYIDKFQISTDVIKMKNYIDTLKDNAKRNLADQFSLCPLFNYSAMAKKDTSECKNIISSLSTLLTSSQEYLKIISNNLSLGLLKKLYSIFLGEYKGLCRYNKIIDFTNEISETISNELSSQSSTVRIKNIDAISLFKNRYIKFKFNKLLGLWADKIVFEKAISNKFKKTIKVFRQTNKTQLKSALGVSNNKKIDYLKDMSPFDAYLNSLDDKNITTGFGNERYKLFFGYEVNIENEFGNKVSGGEKAEYLLLNKLSDYQKYDMVIIDEMESSFDNPFLNKEIIDLLHRISKNVTVFISTHNNNLGVSLNPDYYIFHEKLLINKNIVFKRFYGKSSDSALLNKDGGSVKTSDMLINTMEANIDAYNERSKKYEDFKN